MNRGACPHLQRLGRGSAEAQLLGFEALLCLHPLGDPGQESLTSLYPSFHIYKTGILLERAHQVLMRLSEPAAVKLLGHCLELYVSQWYTVVNQHGGCFSARELGQCLSSE